MARQFSETEIQEFIRAEVELKQLGLHVSNQDERGVNNGKVLGQYFAANPQVAVTRDSIVNAATTTLRSQLEWKTPTELQAERIASQMTEADVNTVLQWVKTRGLLHESNDDLLTNFTIVAGYALSQGISITISNLDSRTVHITGSPSGYKLRWAKKLQDSEVAEKQRREAAAKVPARQEERAQLTNNDPEVRPLAPHLVKHKEMLDRPADGKPASPKDTISDWQKNATEVLANTNSNVDRAKAEKLVGYVNGDVDWEGTYTLRRLFLEQRKNERQNAGR
jgi:hypothetical protein